MWKCTVDDPIFESMNATQWLWYSEMISKEHKANFDRQVDIAEYLASFWDHDAVRKIRESRAQRDIHAFKDDKEFEESILNDSYKNDPLVQALRKIKENEIEELRKNEPRQDYRKTKPPTDLSRLSRLIKKF